MPVSGQFSMRSRHYNIFFMKRIIGGIIILVVVAGIMIVWRGHAPENKTSGTVSIDGTVAVVYMSVDGFAPSEIRIKPGTKVSFVNDDKFWHWPASDLHPTHTLYPEFDPRKAIGPGETWSFTFERLGSWGYHDHLAPYVVGKIIVSE